MATAFDKAYTLCLERLLELKAPARLGMRDASLFDAYSGEQEEAARFLGWVDLSTKPPLSAKDIIRIAESFQAEGIEAVVLIGQGGSSQAAMTITKLHEVSGEGIGVAFRTMDSLSPVFVNHILGSSDPARTVYVVSSKSGSTLEPLMLERVVWQYVQAHLGSAEAAQRFVAITDPESKLEHMAREKGYRAVLSSPVDVGGRFSALTVFSLLPAALVGIDIKGVIENSALTELACRSDSPVNPALKLASFLYAGYSSGRDKFSLVLPPSGQVFGLWVEQLVAESLGKQGIGILPNVEVDASILSVPRSDRCVITYQVGETEGFSESVEHIDADIPELHYTIDNPFEAYSNFVLWEYAIAFLGIMLGVNPFDQPDVEHTKTLVREMLSQGLTELTGDVYVFNRADNRNVPCQIAGASSALIECDQEHFSQFDFAEGSIRAFRISEALRACDESDTLSIDYALRTLLGSLKPGDYFSLNAFLPFRGYGRREALERMRNRVASRLGVASCLEIGPRYLHSTGQLHKGGPNTGVFLLISADEDNDINIPGEQYSLGALAQTIALGDFKALASRGRRALHVHLASNDSELLSRFADKLCSAVSAVKIQ
ncbi:MAG: hypothetical protein LBS98_04695 [Coriobacteriales bacterium]|jgi:glucose-6-phosphate isomerase|nr:hypothetical protein [Coriobacteriales bacterium]